MKDLPLRFIQTCLSLYLQSTKDKLGDNCSRRVTHCKRGFLGHSRMSQQSLTVTYLWSPESTWHIRCSNDVSWEQKLNLECHPRERNNTFGRYLKNEDSIRLSFLITDMFPHFRVKLVHFLVSLLIRVVEFTPVPIVYTFVATVFLNRLKRWLVSRPVNLNAR